MKVDAETINPDGLVLDLCRCCRVKAPVGTGAQANVSARGENVIRSSFASSAADHFQIQTCGWQYAAKAFFQSIASPLGPRIANAVGCTGTPGVTQSSVKMSTA